MTKDLSYLENYNFPVTQEKMDYFIELYKKDKFQNLQERAIYFSKLIGEEKFDRNYGWVNNIINNYWCVTQSYRDDNYVYSIGMTYEYGHPEIMVISDNLPATDMARIVNETGYFISKGNTIQEGKDYTKEILEKRKFDVDIIDDKVQTKDGDTFMLIELTKPLIFKKYTPEMEEQFDKRHIHFFYPHFADIYDSYKIEILYTDLR